MTKGTNTKNNRHVTSNDFVYEAIMVAKELFLLNSKTLNFSGVAYD